MSAGLICHDVAMKQLEPVSDSPQPTAPARPARSGTATAAVVAHLEDVIFGGERDAGDALPSENELSAELGVSRLTVREAIRTLQARGLVEVSHGRRPVVAHPNAAPLHDFFSSAVRRDARGLLELLDVRLAVEVHTAELAARHATRADISGLEAALHAMRDATDDEHAFNAADIRFHAAIAAASGNRMLSLLVEGMEQPLQAGRMHSVRGYLTGASDLRELVGPHEQIYEAIAARDAAEAAATMRRHLVGTRNDLRRSFALG